MRKKLLTVALAATMVVSSVFSAFAADTITSTAWWNAWTPGYEVKDGETLELDIEVKGADRLWDNINAVFVNVKTDGTVAPSADNISGYKEYVVLRGDNYGWGDAYANTKFEGGRDELADDDTFIAMMKDAHLDVTINKSGETIVYKYVATGANGTTCTRTATVTADTSEGLYVFFTGDADADAGTSVTLTVAQAEGATTPDPTQASTENNEDDASTATTVADTTTDDVKPAKTGDVSSVAVAAIVALGAAVAVVASKKKVTE